MHRNIMTPNVAVSGAGDSTLLPPTHLDKAGAGLWSDVVRQYRIADGAGLALVTTAAECLDRMRQAQEHGVLVRDRYGGLRQNPAIVVERGAQQMEAEFRNFLHAKKRAYLTFLGTLVEMARTEEALKPEYRRRRCLHRHAG